jgi:hypothetical protein
VVRSLFEAMGTNYGTIISRMIVVQVFGAEVATYGFGVIPPRARGGVPGAPAGLAAVPGWMIVPFSTVVFYELGLGDVAVLDLVYRLPPADEPERRRPPA